MASIRDRLAHAATPWEWRARRHVLVLVWTSVLICAAGIGLGWLQGSSGANRATIAVVNGTVLFLLFARPALRALRRWNAIAPAPETPPADAA
jgi:ABC-type uncharacterized transport system permease subunit